MGFRVLHGRPSATVVYALSLHDALPIWRVLRMPRARTRGRGKTFLSPEIMISQRPAEAADHDLGREEGLASPRSEEHTSELQSRRDLVCRLLLEKKKRTEAPASEPEDAG